MEKKIYDHLIVSSSPHAVSKVGTTKIMGAVLLGLLPAFIMSFVVFGPRAIIVTALSAVCCIIFEWLWNKMMKRPSTIVDLSAVVTGVLLAFNLPVNIPLWIVIVGDFVAVIIVKQLFGGLGKNIANPAITARVVLLISFATEMTQWSAPRMAADAVTTATPLGILAEGGAALPSNLDLFLGFTGGSLGEVSAIALLIGGIFLIAIKVISPIIPVCYIATVFVFSLIYYAITGGNAFEMAIFHLLSGGLMLGAFFMATDYVTSPVLPEGKVVFGIGCGLMTMIIRLFGQYPEGVSFSILLMNCLTPLINGYFMNRRFGGDKNGKK